MVVARQACAACRAALDEALTFHSFRVNYINGVVKSGADLKTIMALARHSSATMSMSTYAKTDAQRLRTVAESGRKR
jgi:integrase